MKHPGGNDVDWSKADGLWSQLTTREIAALMGVPYVVAFNKRKKLRSEAAASGASTAPFGRVFVKRTKLDWSKADGLWAQFNNREMVERLGFTYSAVIGKRSELIREAVANKAPTAPFQGPPQNRSRIDWSKAHGLWPKMNDRQLGKAMGVSSVSVKLHRHLHILQAAREGKSTEPYLYRKA